MKLTEKFLEEYIETLNIEELFTDGMIIFDTDGIARYSRQFRKDIEFFPTSFAVGKHLTELYPSINPADSTIYAAFQGVPTISQLTTQTTYKGVRCDLLESTFPIRSKGEIVGAISFGKQVNHFKQELQLTAVSTSTIEKKGLFQVNDIIGESPQMYRLKEQIAQIAQTTSSVLICGKTGTGKEMVAQSIHSASKRRNKVFLSQNCSAIPANLLESIFFGTVKGSYTGAYDHAGIFEAANHGTIFLDEINSMSPEMQAKILRVLEERKVTRIGSNKPIPVDVRIISAMNEDPEKCIEEGRLRSDLFYRLSTVNIEIPSLKDRREDIPILSSYYMDKYNLEMGKNITAFSDEVMQMFREYSWPGNVRELKNVIEGAFNFVSDSTIEVEHLPSFLRKACGKNIPRTVSTAVLPEAPCSFDCTSLKDAVESYEKSLIEYSMKSVKNLNQLASKLGLSRQALKYKIEKYQIPELYEK